MRGTVRVSPVISASLFADATRDAFGVFGKLQSPFDQPGDREARQIRMVLPDGFCVALPSTPLCRTGGLTLACAKLLARFSAVGWSCPSM